MLYKWIVCCQLNVWILNCTKTPLETRQKQRFSVVENFSYRLKTILKSGRLWLSVPWKIRSEINFIIILRIRSKWEKITSQILRATSQASVRYKTKKYSGNQPKANRFKPDSNTFQPNTCIYSKMFGYFGERQWCNRHVVSLDHILFLCIHIIIMLSSFKRK